jgi:hypothetical protein
MRQVRVCGLDYPFTVLRPSRRLGAARLVSTPSRRGLGASRAWLGIASEGFPEFGQFCIRGFPRSTQVALQVRCVYRFRHARVTESVYRWEPSGGYSILQTAIGR